MLINQFLSLKIKPPKNYDLPLPLHGIIIYVITSNMHDNFTIIIIYNKITFLYTTLTPKIKGKGMQIYLISHTQVCDIKKNAHLSVRYKRYRTLILIKTFQTILEPFYEMVISPQLYIGSPNHYDCGFEFLCKYFRN